MRVKDSMNMFLGPVLKTDSYVESLLISIFYYVIVSPYRLMGGGKDFTLCFSRERQKCLGTWGQGTGIRIYATDFSRGYMVGWNKDVRIGIKDVRMRLE